jgi:hypothetical protein
VKRELLNQFFAVDQRIVAELNGLTLELRVKELEVVDLQHLATGEEDFAPAKGELLYNYY